MSQRFSDFVRFFRGYQTLAAVAVGSAPFLSQKIGAIPMFPAMQSLATGMATVICYFAVGYVFYCRHYFATLLFPKQIISLLMDKRDATELPPQVLRTINRLMRYTKPLKLVLC